MSDQNPWNQQKQPSAGGSGSPAQPSATDPYAQFQTDDPYAAAVYPESGQRGTHGWTSADTTVAGQAAAADPNAGYGAAQPVIDPYVPGQSAYDPNAGQYGQYGQSAYDPNAEQHGQYGQPAYDPNATQQYGQPVYDPNAAQQPPIDPNAASQYNQSMTDPNLLQQHSQSMTDPNAASQHNQSMTDPNVLQQQYGQQGYGTPTPQRHQRANSGHAPAQGGLGDLFDLSFTRWATPRAVKVIYLVAICAISIAMLSHIIGAAQLIGISQGSTVGFLITLVIDPLWGLLCIAGVRVGLESAAALIRIAENTSSTDSSHTDQS